MPFVREIPPEKLSAAQRTWAVNYLLKEDPRWSNSDKVNSLKAEYDAIAKRSPATMVMDDKPTPAFAYVLKRGQYDQLGEKVDPGVPEGAAAHAGGRAEKPARPGQMARRSGESAALAGDGQPLLAAILRHGHRKTSEDFGIMGERPVESAAARLAGGGVP